MARRPVLKGLLVDDLLRIVCSAARDTILPALQNSRVDMWLASAILSRVVGEELAAHSLPLMIRNEGRVRLSYPRIKSARVGGGKVEEKRIGAYLIEVSRDWNVCAAGLVPLIDDAEVGDGRTEVRLEFANELVVDFQCRCRNSVEGAGLE